MRAGTWVFVAAAGLHCAYGARQKGEPSGRLADDTNLDISQAMGSTAATTTMTLKPDDKDLLPAAHNVVHNLGERVEELEKLHPNAVHVTEKEEQKRKHALDATHEHTINLCQRDYTQPCPLGFKHIAMEGGEHRCVPSESYTGPCVGQNLVYRDMPEEERVAWARDCLANWPCVQCRRRYSDMCPEKWELNKGAGAHVCQATEEYTGPCKGETVSFIHYNIEMQKQWSRRCLAWWPCEPRAKPADLPDFDLPITKGATVYRLAL